MAVPSGSMGGLGGFFSSYEYQLSYKLGTQYLYLNSKSLC